MPDISPDTGDPIHRPATTADVLVPQFANEAAARASNGGALPPDMSLLAAAREGGAAYVYSIAGDHPATTPTPAGLTVPPGKYYNPYFPGDVSANWTGDPNNVPPGGFISMPPPLTDCKVTFDDGTPCTTAQEAKDVAAFLQWAADPKMEERKQMGFAVLIYLLIFSGLLYASYRHCLAERRTTSDGRGSSVSSRRRQDVEPQLVARPDRRRRCRPVRPGGRSLRGLAGGRCANLDQVHPERRQPRRRLVAQAAGSIRPWRPG